MKKLFRKFRYGQKGFTLIELLVVVAILGVLAAVAVPNVGKFIGKGKAEAKSTEYANVLTAVTAAMADAVSANISDAPVGTPALFGNSTYQLQKPYAGDDVLVATGVPDDFYVGAYIAGGAANVAGAYTIANDGTVTQIWFKGDPIP